MYGRYYFATAHLREIYSIVSNFTVVLSNVFRKGVSEKNYFIRPCLNANSSVSVSTHHRHNSGILVTTRLVRASLLSKFFHRTG